MADDTHPLISWHKDFGANTEDDIKRNFMRRSDQERTIELQTLSGWCAENSSGISLRRKSQLWKLGRELGQIHDRLRKVGR